MRYTAFPGVFAPSSTHFSSLQPLHQAKQNPRWLFGVEQPTGIFRPHSE